MTGGNWEAPVLFPHCYTRGHYIVCGTGCHSYQCVIKDTPRGRRSNAARLCFISHNKSQQSSNYSNYSSAFLSAFSTRVCLEQWARPALGSKSRLWIITNVSVSQSVRWFLLRWFNQTRWDNTLSCCCCCDEMQTWVRVSRKWHVASHRNSILKNNKREQTLYE